MNLARYHFKEMLLIGIAMISNALELQCTAKEKGIAEKARSHQGRQL